MGRERLRARIQAMTSARAMATAAAERMDWSSSARALLELLARHGGDHLEAGDLGEVDARTSKSALLGGTGAPGSMTSSFSR